MRRERAAAWMAAATYEYRPAAARPTPQSASHEPATMEPEAAPPPTHAVIERLQGEGLELILPTDGAAYQQARRVWNADIDRRPAVIVRCRSGRDVARTVSACVECRVECTVRGGGHNVGGCSICDGAVLLDLSGACAPISFSWSRGLMVSCSM